MFRTPGSTSVRRTGHTDAIVKKPWIIAIVAVLVVCCGGGGLITFFVVRMGMGVMSEAKNYGDQSVTAICTTWDASALSSRAAPELIAQNPEGTLENVVATMAPAMGPLKSIESSSITGVEAKSATGQTSYMEAQYQGVILCEKGKADVTMTILKRNDKWEILKINFQQVK